MLKQTLVSKNAVCILIYWILAMPLASKAESLPSVDVLANSIKKLSAAVESGDFFEAENILKTIPQKMRQSQIQILILEALVDKGFYRTGAARLKLEKALRLDRNNGDALFEMAVLLMEKRLWRRSEILLKAASLSATLKDSRRQSLPYYFGVTAFELGRIFESRNHFVRLNWMDTLDFAIRQSSNSYLSDIAGKRPWSVVAPVLFQYESNVLGLDDDSALPEGFKRREGGKVVYGLFGNYSGLGGDHQGRGPWGFALRLIASQAVDKEFQGLNLLYSEAEATWSARSAGKNTITVSPSAYTVRVGGKSLNHAVQLKSSFNQNDFSAGFEFDAARNSDTDRSVWVAGIARNFEILQGDAFAVVHPTELGARIPTSKEKGGEFKTEITLSPGVNWYPSKRVSISLNDRFSFSRISANTARYNLLKNKVGLKSTWSFQPYLTLGASYEFELSKQTHSSTLTRKSTATLSVLGLF